MRSQAEKGRLFRELHARPGILILPNPWDAGEGADDIRKDSFVISTRDAVFGTRGHHESGEPAQVLRLCRG